MGSGWGKMHATLRGVKKIGERGAEAVILASRRETDVLCCSDDLYRLAQFPPEFWSPLESFIRIATGAFRITSR